jgi:hypothetical protein
MVTGVVGKIEHVFTEIEGPAESNIVTQAFKKIIQIIFIMIL